MTSHESKGILPICPHCQKEFGDLELVDEIDKKINKSRRFLIKWKHCNKSFFLAVTYMGRYVSWVE